MALIALKADLRQSVGLIEDRKLNWFPEAEPVETVAGADCRTAVSGDGTRDPYSRPTNSKTTALATIVAAINSRCRIGWADNRIMAAVLPAFPHTC